MVLATGIERMAEATPLLASGWPVAISLGAAALAGRARRVRRREAAAEALHELRRPLQLLMLGAPAEDVARQALVATDDLSRALEGRPATSHRTSVRAYELLLAASRRWRSLCGRERVGVEWQAEEHLLIADPDRLAQALDNLVANSLEHGGGRRTLIRATSCRRGLRIEVAEERPSSAIVRHAPRGPGLAGRARELTLGLALPVIAPGQGLRVARRIAREHGGRLCLRARDGRFVAALELPSAPGLVAASALAGTGNRDATAGEPQRAGA